MLRGFRWQFVALVFALILFIVAVTTRSNPQPGPQPTAITENTPTAAAENTPLPTETPIPAAEATQLPASIVDTVPTYREALVGDVRRLNPLLRGLNPAEDDITSLIFEGLVRTNQYGEPEPDLATDWVVASNYIEYVFTLRRDVLWHDGTPFTARDVAFTMELLRDPNFPGDPEVGAFWQTVETQVLDDYTVRFRLTQPLGSFLDALRVGILPEHALSGTTAEMLIDHPFNLSPIGTGPYQREAIRTDDGSRITVVDLRAAPVYAQRPEGQSGFGVERVRFQMYESFDDALSALNSGNVDGLATRNRAQRLALLNLPDVTLHTKLEPTLGTLIFNWRRPEDSNTLNPFREDRVRNALVRGANRDSAVQRHMLNVAVPANNPLMPGSWAFAADIGFPGYDPQTSLSELERVDLEVESEGATEEPAASNPLDFSILVPEDPALANLAAELAGQWGQIGLSVTVESEAPDAYRERLNSGTFDMAIVELSLGNSADPDVYSFWHQGQFPDGDNVSAVDDRRISETLERARRDPFGLNRIEHYRDFQTAFVERSIAIPLYYPLYTYVVSERVDGVQLGFVGEPSDRLRNIREWTIADTSQ
ncbi:MAG: ABC transporter substrate-binding protein [Chloroflexota bacterium]